MKIFVKVRPSAKAEKVEKVGENDFAVSVKEPPKEGKANDAVIKLLAKYFGVSKSAVNIFSGKALRQKIVEISDDESSNLVLIKR